MRDEKEAKAGVYLRTFFEWACWWDGERGAAHAGETALFRPTLLGEEGDVVDDSADAAHLLTAVGEVVEEPPKEESPKRARLTLIRGGK